MAATDTFGGRGGSIDAPASGVEAITPHASNELTSMSRAVWVGAAGDVAVVMADGSTATLVGVPAGTLLPIRVKRIAASGTTATSLVALF